MRVALELVLTPVGMLDNDVPRSTAGHIRDGVPEHLSSCSRRVHRVRTRWQNRVCVNVDCLLSRPLSNTKLGLVAIVGSGWGHGPHC